MHDLQWHLRATEQNYINTNHSYVTYVNEEVARTRYDPRDLKLVEKRGRDATYTMILVGFISHQVFGPFASCVASCYPPCSSAVVVYVGHTISCLPDVSLEASAHGFKIRESRLRGF